MNKMLTAIALTIALPAVAIAQPAPAPAPAPMAESHEKMMAHCKDMMAKMGHSMSDMKPGAMMPAGHDMSSMSKPAAKTPQADAPQNRQQ